MVTSSSSSHSCHGCIVARSRFTSVSGTIRPPSRSTRNIVPGSNRPFARVWLSGMSRTPVSEAKMTRSSSVICQRPGRRPLRSMTAPMLEPSVKVTAAGPSHGSIRQAEYW